MATSPGGCRQTLTVPPAGALPAAVSPHRTAALLDATARQLRTALLYLAVPLAAAAHALNICTGWKEFGYARLSDHARERYGRSARWLRDRADLHEALERLPGLGEATSGDDGGSPLGVVAASLIGRIASPESLPVWLSLARSHSVRDLKKMTRGATSRGTCWPAPEDSLAAVEIADSHARLPGLCLMMPAAVREAFHETLALYRAVEGHEASPDEFVGSLVAEAATGPLGAALADALPRGGKSSFSSLPTASAKSRKDTAAAFDGIVILERQSEGRATRTKPNRRDAHASGGDRTFEDVSLRRSVRLWLGQILAEIGAHQGSPALAADTRIRRLLALHDELERRLDEAIIQMSATTSWRALGYGGLPDYAHQALGWERSTIYARLALVRRLRRLPVVERAFSEGRIGRMAAHSISRVLLRDGTGASDSRPAPAATQQAWVERAARATCRRLQDETRAVARLMALDAGDHACEPLEDQEWHASLKRHPGLTRRRLEALTRMALTEPAHLHPLHLQIEPETAADLVRLLTLARRDPGLVQTFSRLRQEQHEASPGTGRGQAGVPAFSTARDGVPLWAALLALLQEFADTWDVDLTGRRPFAGKIYNRDGWRCMAPGCTSRRNLEVHHIVYRSQGGDDRPDNLVCLCRFHHQMGEHGLLAKVRGEAPVQLVWRLGRDGSGGRFRNDLRLTG